MEERNPEIRRLPLKIAGVIGFFSAALYLAVVLGQEDTTQLPLAIFWLIVMTAASALAWLSDGVPGRERQMAIGATIVFFVLAMFSSALFVVVVYLLATVLSAAGFVGVRTSEAEAPSES